MDLCILENKVVKFTIDGVPVDSLSQTAWRREHKGDCEVAESVISGVRIKTYFRGYDPVGAGYVFMTETSNGDGYGAMDWQQAERHHRWTCEHYERLEECGQLRKAREHK